MGRGAENFERSTIWDHRKDVRQRLRTFDLIILTLFPHPTCWPYPTTPFILPTLYQDKFGPQAGSRSSHRGDAHRGDDYRPSSGYSESRESRDRGYGSTTSSSRYDDYRRESNSGRSRDYYESSSHGHSSSSRGGRHDDMSMDSVPSGPAAGSGDRIYIRNVWLSLFVCMEMSSTPPCSFALRLLTIIVTLTFQFKYPIQLPFTTTNQDLRDLFRICGSIRSAEVLMQDGRAKGSGVVRFESFEAADKAVGKISWPRLLPNAGRDSMH